MTPSAFFAPQSLDAAAAQQARRDRAEQRTHAHQTLVKGYERSKPRRLRPRDRPKRPEGAPERVPRGEFEQVQQQLRDSQAAVSDLKAEIRLLGDGS